MKDITARLYSWLSVDDKHAGDETLREARDESVRLRALLERQGGSSFLAVKLMGDLAQQYEPATMQPHSRAARVDLGFFV